MTGAIVTLAVALALPAGPFSRGRTVAVVPAGPAAHAHAGHAHGYPATGGRILPPGPGYGWGYANGNPDGYGYFDRGTYLPLGGDRTPEYFFNRYYTLLPEQTFLPSYYNPYVNRGQRYIPYAGCGGDHPFGGPPQGEVASPLQPDRDAARNQPVVPVPDFTGRTEAPPVSSGPRINP
jgi:hypothetical protein